MTQRLIRHPSRTPVVRLPEPLPPPAAALATLEEIATRDGVTIRLPNGFTITPREKRAKRAKKQAGWWFR